MNAAHPQQVILSSSERGLTRTVGLHGFEENFSPRMDEKIQYRAETMPATITQPANDDARGNAIDKIMLATEISMRYHKRRKQHYDGVYKILVFSTLMLSAAAFLLHMTHQGLIGFAVIGLGVISLVWNFSHKAREHDILVNQHGQLLETIRLTHTPTLDHLKQWRMQRMNIQSKEPPIYWAVMNDCTYDVARAWDLKPKKRGCPVMLRPFMNWIRF
ncbi:MAG TPA: hypothetical protein VGF14_00180 [Alphaproteobacteria bacterium]